MLFVCRVLLSRCFLPSVVLGEEGVGVGGRVVNLGKAESVGYGERLLVDACSTYYIYVLVLCAVGERFLERRVAVAAFELGGCATEHHVATVGQGALGERLERAASHDDGVARGERLETLQVVGQPIE